MVGEEPPDKDQLTEEDQELIELYHDLSKQERTCFIGLLRAIHDARTVPLPPIICDHDDNERK